MKATVQMLLPRIALGPGGWYFSEASMRPGLTEILIILGIALLLFGAGRLADIGKGLGEGIRNFKKGLKDDEDEDAEALPEGGDKPEE
jgi:sec-independent protein translocase protein TatA